MKKKGILYIIILSVFLVQAIFVNAQITNKLLHYWNMNETVSPLNDSINNTKPLETAGITSSSGFIGKAWLATSTGQAAFNASSPISPFPDNNFTVTAWINTTGIVSGTLGTILSFGNPFGASTGMTVLLSNAGGNCNGSIRVRIDATDIQNHCSNDMIGSNTWQFVTIVYNTTQVTYFHNGTRIGASNHSINPTGTPADWRIFMRKDNTDTFRGQIDEVGIWNRTLNESEITTLFNGGTGCSYPFTTCNFSEPIPPPVALLNVSAPTHNGEAPERTEQNYSIFIDYNISFFNGSNATLIFNTTNITPFLKITQDFGNNSFRDTYTATNNISLIDINNTLVNITWHIRVFNQTGAVVRNFVINSTQNLTFGFLPIAINANNVIEGEPFSISPSLKKSVLSVTSINLSLFYNNSLITSSLFFENNSFIQQLSNQNAFPNLGSQDNNTYNITASWMVTDSGKTVTRNQSLNQTVFTMLLKKCSPGDKVTQNISYQNVNTFTGANVDSQLFYAIMKGSIQRNFSFTFFNNATNEVCIKPNNANLSFSANLQLLSNSSLFIATTFNQINATRTINTENITLFLIPSDAVNLIFVTIEVIDQDEEPLVQHIVQVEKLLLTNNTFILIANDLTDINGQAKFNLDAGTNQYRFKVIDQQGINIFQTIPFKLLQTFYRFIIPSKTFTVIQNLINFKNMQHNLTYTSATRTVILNYNDAGNISSRVCLKVQQTQILNATVLFSNCSNSKIDTISFTIPSNINNTGIEGIAFGFTKNPKPFIIETIDILDLVPVGAKFEGLFLTFIISLVMVGAGLAGGPITVLILSVVGILISAITGLFVISAGVIVGIIFVAALIAIKSRI